MQSQFVTRSLVCGKCEHCRPTQQGTRRVCICILFDVRVMSYYPFCEAFERGGVDVTPTILERLEQVNAQLVLA